MREKNLEFVSLDKIRWQLVVGRLVGMTVALVALALISWLVHAAPVHSQEECVMLGDMVVVAQALQRHGTPPETAAKILVETHLMFVGAESLNRWARYLQQVQAFVRKPEHAEVSPKDLGTTFAQACGQLQGDVDKIFGIAL